MNKMEKRLEELEKAMIPQDPFVQVIQNLDESREEAIAKAGLTLEDFKAARRVIWTKII